MLNYLSNFLSFGGQKQVVGVALTPGVGLEAVIVDQQKNVILNYGRRKVEYNFSTREINDYTQFKTALVELMDELRIPAKSYVYYILPNVYFDFIEIPPTIGPIETKTAILSKAEEFYLFKKEEPVSGYCEIINPNGGTQKKLAYSSLQKSAVDELREITTDIGLQLAGIESAYSATLRGLYLTGNIDSVIAEQSAWTAMIINTNSYTLFQMDGKDLIDYAEVPIAIKSFSSEEAYQAIVSSSMQLLSSFQSVKLYIISQTDDICAEVLKGQLEYDREIVTVDSNKYAKRRVLEAAPEINDTYINSVSLASIGATKTKTDFNLVLNVLADDPDSSMGVYFTTQIGGQTIEVTGDLVKKTSFALCAIFILIFGIAYGGCSIANNKITNEYKTLDAENKRVKAEIDKLQSLENKDEIDMNAIIDQIAQLNVIANSFYDSIATDIPKNVWLTKYFNQAGDRLAIQGIAENIVDIYEYYKNLRIVSPKSDIKLTELKVVTASENEENSPINDLAINSDTDRLYSFEISNTRVDFDTSIQNDPPENENQIIVKPNSDSKSKSKSKSKPKSKSNVESTSKQMKPAR